MKTFQQLAKSEYYDIIKKEFSDELIDLMKPENIPTNDLTEVKAHVLLASFLQKKIIKLDKMRKDEQVTKETIKLSAKERRDMNSSE